MSSCFQGAWLTHNNSRDNEIAAGRPEVPAGFDPLAYVPGGEGIQMFRHNQSIGREAIHSKWQQWSRRDFLNPPRFEVTLTIRVTNPWLGELNAKRRKVQRRNAGEIRMSGGADSDPS